VRGRGLNILLVALIAVSCIAAQMLFPGHAGSPSSSSSGGLAVLFCWMMAIVIFRISTRAKKNG
jgi:hypothetical protein